MDDDENGGLFNIEVSSEEEDLEEKVPRDFQSEEDFQRVRAEYKPKIEVGEVSFVFPFFTNKFDSMRGDTNNYSDT